MGVNHKMSVGSVRPELPDGERFAALLSDLVAAHVVSFPALVLSGSIRGRVEDGEDFPGVFPIGTAVPKHPWDPPARALSNRDFDLVIRYAGADPGALLSAVRAAPLGTEDVCVYFVSRYYPPNHGRRPEEMKGCHTGLFATPVPRTLVNDDLMDTHIYEDDPRFDASLAAEFPAGEFKSRWFLQMDNGAAPWELLGSAIPSCARHFGEYFVCCEFW